MWHLPPALVFLNAIPGSLLGCFLRLASMFFSLFFDLAECLGAFVISAVGFNLFLLPMGLLRRRFGIDGGLDDGKSIEDSCCVHPLL